MEQIECGEIRSQTSRTTNITDLTERQQPIKQKRVKFVINKPSTQTQLAQVDFYQPLKSQPKEKELTYTERLLKNQKIDQIFSETRDQDADKLYHLDGNSEFYTQDAIQKRKELKIDQEIDKAVRQYMDLFHFVDGKKLYQNIYSKVFATVAQMLRPDLKEDDQKMEKLIEKEWKRDSKGEKFITKQQLFDSIFELVDIWTPSIGKYEYLQFLKVLKFKTMLNLELV